jgi:hypothetical protein
MRSGVMIEKAIARWKTGEFQVLQGVQDRFIFRGLKNSSNQRPDQIEIFGVNLYKDEVIRILRDTAGVVGTNGVVVINGETADEFIQNHECELH